MTSEEFVKRFYLEKQELINEYFDPVTTLQVGVAINSLNLTDKQRAILKTVINGALTDLCYSILLGLDGAAQIGGTQERYKILDESGKELTGGDIETYAWEYFQNHE